MGGTVGTSSAIEKGLCGRREGLGILGLERKPGGEIHLNHEVRGLGVVRHFGVRLFPFKDASRFKISLLDSLNWLYQ